MAEDAEDKSEEPTGRKLGQAREEGQVPQSQEIRIWAGLVGTLVVLSLMGPGLAEDVSRLMLPFIAHPHDLPMDRESLGALLSNEVIEVIKVMAMPLGLLLFLAVGSNVAQNGLMFVPKRLAPDFNKLNPMSGVKRMFSVRNLVEFGKSLLKVGAIGFVLFLTLRSHMDEYIGLAAVDLMGMVEYLRHQVVFLVMVVVLMVTALAAADYTYQRWTFMQQMRMTKQEVKDEHKQTEGDPMVKGRLRGLRMQRARQRMMSAIPQATVVVTNPTHFACALKYDMEAMGAPVLVAKGADLIAKRIRELAEENEVPVVENPPLARALYATVELDQEVPPEHYKAVAEVIGYVMKLKGKLAR